jgi:hypothetical protein
MVDMEVSWPNATGSAAFEGLCYLIRDFEALALELLAAEDAMGEPTSTHRAPLSLRLSRAGVNHETVEAVRVWREDLSNLLRPHVHQVDELPHIMAVERAGSILLKECLDSVKARENELAKLQVGKSLLAA